MCVSESVVVHLCLSNTCNMFNVIDDTLLYAMSIFIFSIIILFIHLVVDVNFPLYVFWSEVIEFVVHIHFFQHPFSLRGPLWP
jgi:hypothetical protein